MDSIYERIAALKWPGYTIEGAGCIACVFPCSQKVQLVELPLAAVNVARFKCADCLRIYGVEHSHKIVHLNKPAEPSYARRGVVPRFPHIRDRHESCT